tara:strand:- start:11655 stop:11888 length:234 start_codon:yes stop_codon:yes gene_type:complete
MATSSNTTAKAPLSTEARSKAGGTASAAGWNVTALITVSSSPTRPPINTVSAEAGMNRLGQPELPSCAAVAEMEETA